MKLPESGSAAAPGGGRSLDEAAPTGLPPEPLASFFVVTVSAAAVAVLVQLNPLTVVDLVLAG